MWIAMNISGRGRSVCTPSGTSCATRVSAIFRKLSKLPRVETWPRMSSISVCCAHSCENLLRSRGVVVRESRRRAKDRCSDCVPAGARLGGPKGRTQALRLGRHRRAATAVGTPPLQRDPKPPLDFLENKAHSFLVPARTLRPDRAYSSFSKSSMITFKSLKVSM